jgi:hypothetical protein
MDLKDSPPAPDDKSGGNDDDFDLKSQDDPSQDDSIKDAAEKQDDDTKGDDDQPSKSDDDKSEDDKKSDDDADDKDAPASKFDDDLDEWAEKRGLGKLENDKERQIAQLARDNQRDTRKGMQADKAKIDVNRAIQDAKPEPKKDGEEDDERDPAEIRAERAEEIALEERNLRLRSEYFTENNISDEESNAMGEILKEKVDKAADDKKSDVYDYWTNPENLADWHSLAKARVSGNTDTSAIEEKAAREERERIAKESNAKSPSRNASNRTSGEKSEEERRLENFSNWD